MNIGFAEMVETIAHELAHAVVSKLLVEYRPNNGGHGPLHDDFICRIKEFMEGTDEFKSFKK